MRIALLSDILGNIWALKAVLDDISNRRVDCILNLGNSLYGPMAPRETADLLRQRKVDTVSGVLDRILLDCPQTGELGLMSAFTRKDLDRPVLDWLNSLPVSMVCSPRRPGTGERFRTHADEAEKTIGTKGMVSVSASALRIGRQVYRFSRFFNGLCRYSPGRIGLQAFREEVPSRCIFAQGSPHARYAVVTWDRGQLTTDLLMVNYPWDLAAATALANGRPDWAVWLKTGTV